MASRLNSGPGLPRGRLQVSRLTEIIHQRVPSMASSRPDGESGPPPRCQREPHLPVSLTTSLPMLVVSAPSLAQEEPPREEESIVQLGSELPFCPPWRTLSCVSSFSSSDHRVRKRLSGPPLAPRAAGGIGIALFGRPLLTCSLPAPSRGVTRAGKAPEARSSCRQYYTPSAGTAARSAPQGLARTPRVLLPVPAVP